MNIMRINFNNDIKTRLFLAVISIILMVLGWMIARYSGLLISFFIALLMNITAYCYSDTHLLRAFHAHQLQDQNAITLKLLEIVKALATKACIPIPKIYIINTDVPNAFAVGREPATASIIVTSALTKILTQEELTAVLAYEIICIKNGNTWIDSVSAVLGNGFMKFSSPSAWLGMKQSQTNHARNFGTVFLIPFSAGLVRLLNSHGRQYEIDKMTAQLCDHPAWLASALKKLEENKSDFFAVETQPSTAHLFIINPLKQDKVNALFTTTHSSVSDRILHLNQAV